MGFCWSPAERLWHPPLHAEQPGQGWACCIVPHELGLASLLDACERTAVWRCPAAAAAALDALEALKQERQHQALDANGLSAAAAQQCCQLQKAQQRTSLVGSKAAAAAAAAAAAVHHFAKALLLVMEQKLQDLCLSRPLAPQLVAQMQQVQQIVALDNGSPLAPIMAPAVL